MMLMRQLLASNEGANSAALSADARRNPTPDKGHRILPVPVRPRIAVRDPEQLEELLSHLKPATNPEREKIMTLLQSGQFEFLSRLVSEKQAAFDKGKLSEAQLLNTYFTFLSSAPDLRAKFDAWIHAQPTSYVPRVARGLYNTRLGWVARGTAYAQETASERFALMRTHFEAAIRDFDAALTRNPKLSVAWQNLVGISLAEGQPITDNLYNRGIEQVPSSVELRRAYASFFHPNWGSGLSLPLESFNATLAERNARWLKFYKALQADSAAVPALKPVVTSAQYRAAKHSFLNRDFTAASRRLVDAFTAGDESLALAALGRRQMAKRDYQAAVRSFDQALREGPRWNDNLRSRAKALGRLAHATRNFEAYKFALADYQSALELAPFDPDLLSEAASMVAGLPATFPDRAEQALEEMWKNPVSCQPHVEAPKKFTVIHTVPPDTLPVKIYCVAQWLFDKALVYGKSDPDIREARGRFYLFAMKFPSLAVKEYEAIIELNADQASTWERYALALHEIGDCRAIAAYQQHIARCKDGGCPTHVANMSRIHLSQLSLSSDCGG
jgi:tetratricopeptide (TPR) repeat protein